MENNHAHTDRPKFIFSFADSYRNPRHVTITAWFLAIALLLVACGGSTPLTTTEPSPQSNTTPATTISDLPLAEIPQSKYLRFGHLTSEKGLSNDSVWGIAQDNQGFMWFATLDGLNRYDGNDFKLYRHDPDDPHSLSDNTIRGLIADHAGTLWIGTWANGLNQYDHSTESFFRYQHNPDDPHTLSNDSIRSVLEDRTGALWVGTVDGLNKFDRATKQFTRYLHDPDNPNSLGGNVIEAVIEDRAGVLWVSTGAGLDQFDPATERFVHYQHNPDDTQSISHNSVRSIFEDSSGTIWVGTMAGLNKFDRDTEQFIRYQHDPDDPSSMSHNAVFLVYEDQAGILWIGTWGGGLNSFDRDTETFAHYQANSTDPHSLSNNNVWQIYEDQAGMTWIATDGGGVNIIDRGGKPFRHYRSIPGDPNSLSENAVRAIYANQAGVLWIGTNSGGLAKFDIQTEQFTDYKHDPDDPNSLRSNSVWAIYEDNMRNLWLGGMGSGLIKFDRDTERFTHYRNDPGDPHSLSNDSIFAIYEDQEGVLWIGTNGGGLNRFDRETEQFTRYQHDSADPGTLSHNQVTTIYEDRSGVLWIGTLGGGLDILDRENGLFTHYIHNPDDPNSLAVNAVFSLYEDQKDRFWIATMGGGLDRFDRENEQFIHYTIKNGLSSNTVWGILEEEPTPDDEGGNLWLSTTWGLSRFNPQTETFRNYDVSDGLQGNSFLATTSYYKGNGGEMFFGGTNGFNAFYPEQIVDNPQDPSVQITDFLLANQPMSIGGDSVLQQSILETDELVLSYQDNVFSFEFAALNFRASEKNRYKYKMEGFEEQWNEVDSTRRFSTYTNLDPGDYVFRVIASNNDGVWNEEGASVKITITPPWWETTWFRVGLGLIVIGLLAVGYTWRVRSIEAGSRELERLVQERSAALNSAEEQINTLFENSQIGIGLSSLDGEILSTNGALLEMTGYNENEILGINVIKLYQEPEQRAKLLEQLQESNAVRDFGIKLLRKDGTDFFASLNVSTLVRDGREVILTLIEDVTERVKAEDLLEQTAAQAERDRLARDLHDAVTQGIYSASLIAETLPVIWEDDQEEGKRGLQQLERLTQGALAEMRTLLLEMQPEALLHQELPYLVRLLADTMMARGNTSISTTIVGDCEAPTDVRIALYRIAQEALNNVVKHSQARNAKIYLEDAREQIILRISDDGIGFDSENPESHGMGIGIMTKRASDIDASLSITSHSNEGTLILVNWHRSAQE